MPFSHHSHSGQFCGHAQNKLEEVIQTAIEKNMETFAMTEHMPREEQDLYPEEVKANETPATLSRLFDDYYHEATRLREKYAGQIKLLVGMEIDWIRPSSQAFIQDLLSKYQLDLFIGSVHHMHGVPMDYSREMFLEAREKSGGTDERMFEDYFDLQFEMLQKLKPPIVGHFDLIRLLCDDKDGSFAKYAGVWKRIVRNLEFIVQYGGLLEINSAALRKGMKEPYPDAEICKEFLTKGGQFVLSDDSHGIDHVATHYKQAFEFLHKTGIETITCFEKNASTKDPRFLGVSTRVVNLEELGMHPFFTQRH